MFGDEINAFVSLDLIYEHTEFLNPDLFRLLRMHLDHYFFKIEKRLVMTLLGIQIRSVIRNYDSIVEKHTTPVKGKIMPMRLYFDNSYDTLLRPLQWLCAIDTILAVCGGGGHYYVNGVKITPETYPENDVFNGFPNWLHFGFSDHSRMDYCVNLVDSARAAPMDAAVWGYKPAKENLRENMDFEETQIIKHRIEEIV
tara:strand:- start:2263 stop:2856 length:594 start_codon:yes stop_codon:yes gene_type:complete